MRKNKKVNSIDYSEVVKEDVVVPEAVNEELIESIKTEITDQISEKMKKEEVGGFGQ